ncbi:WhiB family transcriptional regulator [Pseudonocardia sp. KRD-169]|uniref:Transcriptional regulator WhiB n=2 Tax=Pseudonocardia abyssalis TaxID=2792008 RepID=A0ABS6V233_9PSEU|nr:WhiB family transcriptional regulator [Pseudonocardia abyssalis]MBW0114172.1 WhiB family transcriptional regulator [Pseudonocardia abyssalis]MBW0138565.1 WhiB family transcriptional regulator [Pseudonocardia abyssalis]
MGGSIPSTTDPTWQRPCHVHDPNLWFAETPADLETAKRHCGSCRIRPACLRGALSRGEPWGVWGGEILDRGVVVAVKRPRGRPPKAGGRWPA